MHFTERGILKLLMEDDILRIDYQDISQAKPKAMEEGLQESTYRHCMWLMGLTASWKPRFFCQAI
jgi:hypothetical protein